MIENKTKDFYGLSEIKVAPGVFNPFKDTYSPWMILENLPNVTGKKVLDIGTGTGILSIAAANRGAKSVTAIDINETAIENARLNFKQHNIKGVKLWKSDLFKNINSKFDVILANLWIDASKYGSTNTAIHFLTELPNYLNDSGTCVFCFADFGDLPKIEKSIKETNLQCTKITKKEASVTWHTYILKQNPWMYLSREYLKRNISEDEKGLKEVLSLLGKKHKILDYGCGPGRVGQTLSENQELTGVDISYEAIKLAKEQDSKSQYFHNTEYKIREEYYDAVMLNFVLCCIDDAKEMIELLTQIRYELKNKGQLIILEALPEIRKQKFKKIYNRFPREGEKIKVTLKGMSRTFYDHYWSEKALETFLRIAGFEDINQLEIDNNRLIIYCAKKITSPKQQSF